MITLIATTIAKPGCLEKFLQALRVLVPQVRAEKGCVSYDVHTDYYADFTEKSYRENRITFVETWEDAESLKAHWNAPHLNVYREATRDFVESKSSIFLERIES